ncbi:MAG: hypothetical protein COT35_08070 [Nitrospirae bacterium CG08_land_8_20_14_0_20_52_24]|nr:MAG: hypothetical protein AUK29_08305 [Nitrospirae bacterium CG2_30_53_67]PIS37029.1 MAG: hypothetical protein COT35_08070 [Nitrospirae bacterium CG08_land_8_20_14_0_20_52_24]PIV85496.1 MAG: hypothetical protein COW52_01900 [Nitrospirae bacterium CG17_big_fil_post_rev_8_21_14_2_50_50_9]PIX86938.1 MAG: hypothetical protein COZ32_00775 [Nitrospirae bacterium CG_4_10_14_3_um_filter_53_41]
MTRSLSILTPNPVLPAADVLIYTIGHGNWSLEDFLALLNEFGIQYLVDVRSLPGSRKHPLFHIVASGKLMEHHLSTLARKQGDSLVYDLQSQKQLEFE